MQEGAAPDNETNWEYNAESTYSGGDVSQQQNAGVPLPTLPDISWSASEYLAHSKSAGWYGMLLLGGAALVAVIYFITGGDLFATISVAIAILAVGAYAGRPPATKQYTLSEQGIQVDQATHQYSSFRSFSVVEDGAINSIWLKPLKRFSPMLVMYCSPDEEEGIVNMLSNFLPHEQRELDPLDRLSRKMRF